MNKELFAVINEKYIILHTIDIESTIFICQELGSLSQSRNCPVCGSQMSESKGESTVINLRWRFDRPCSKEVSYLKGSFFKVAWLL
ncbi:hypothetical protein TUBRATIS_21660 [Tubulinosema ratisbonensis]|uniref:Uncharacterized protein n=1 Tax=Tubulinosema ratisbonensis TaxID=291195 RepID=A0A437AK26_9MICR|nr:hypothetical protein TUBRATIS_21660 [Tubulinosema ratisbonensis]